MARLARAGFFGSLPKVHLHMCEPCLVEKATRKSFGKARKASSILELVHSDIYEPVTVMSRHSSHSSHIDDYTRFLFS